ncbi:MAG TPA: apolipoprotein N-acyltransferase [Bryobacteraceae bacterium]|nr:apolipoprotein N-acyltransferase [Bryobacteraceae bacterium]
MNHPVTRYLLAALSAVLLILAFPRFDVAWLASVALAPLLVAIAFEPRSMQRLLLGYLCGVIYWFGVCYWIQTTLALYAGVGVAGSWALFALFCLAKAMHMAVFGLLAGMAMRTVWAIPGIAALWVAIEVTHGSLGFAWLTLGNAGIDMSVPMRVAPFTGVYGISFVFAMMSAALALAFLRRPRWHLAWLAPLPLMILLPRLPNFRPGEQVAVLVQPNISDAAQWTPQSLRTMERGLAYLSLRTVLADKSQPPQLLVWPEVPAPFYADDPDYLQLAANLARVTRTYFLGGVVGHRADGGLLNSALLVTPSGEPVGRYDKVHLVPFGEFVPWPFGFAKKISSEVGDYVPGSKVVVLPVGEHKISTFICYESVFPSFVRQFAADGAELLVNVSNDSWFGRSAARQQHLKIVRMRAAENRRWLLRSTNDGVTATIDPAGRLLGTLPNYVQAASRTGYSYVKETTFYTRYGDWFPLLCAIISAGTLISSTRRGRRDAKLPANRAS